MPYTFKRPMGSSAMGGSMDRVSCTYEAYGWCPMEFAMGLLVSGQLYQRLCHAHS